MTRKASETVVSEIEAVEIVPVSPMVRVLGIVQVLVGIISASYGFYAFASVVYDLILATEGIVSVIGVGIFTAAPLVVLGLFLVNIGRSVRSLETSAFAWVIYSNLISILLYFLVGGLAVWLTLGNVLAIALLMTPAARSYWWALFVEDTRPRIKEIRYSLYLIRRSPLVMAGITILVGYILIAIFVPYFAPYGPEERNWNETLQPPGGTHIWGTDQNGGDIFSMVMWATQIDLKIAVSVVAVALVIGMLIGVAAGYFGGAVDEIVMRVTDVFFAFPGLILAMAIVSALGERNLDNIAIALMIIWWPTYARLVRGQVLLEREKLYVEAARSVGASDLRIMLSHILPNTIQPVIVQATLDMGGVLLTAAGLSFIGYGAEAGTAEWGLMISTGQDHFILFWMIFYPGMAMLLCALAFNLVGDGARDILDPKLRRR
ncbi:MAG: ABC transporter permease [Candidatus Thorarchaeota archaeon]|jgi:peptide/nickel transport system permease protein